MFQVKRESTVSLHCSSGRLVFCDPVNPTRDAFRSAFRSGLGSEPLLTNCATGEWAIRRLRGRGTRTNDASERDGAGTAIVQFVHGAIARVPLTNPPTNLLHFRCTSDWSDSDAFADADGRGWLRRTFGAAEMKRTITESVPGFDPSLHCRNVVWCTIHALASGDAPIIDAVHVGVLDTIAAYLIVSAPDPDDEDDDAADGDEDEDEAEDEDEDGDGDEDEDEDLLNDLDDETRKAIKDSRDEARAMKAANKKSGTVPAAGGAPAPAPALAPAPAPAKVKTPARFEFKVRAATVSATTPVSKWVKVGSVAVDSVAAGVFDVPDSVFGWSDRAAEVDEYLKVRAADPASALKTRAEFEARLLSLSQKQPLGLFHNYTKWLPVDADAELAATATTAATTTTATAADVKADAKATVDSKAAPAAVSAAAAPAPAAAAAVAAGSTPVGVTAANFASDKIRDVAHGVWCDSGPGDGEYTVYAKYIDVPVVLPPTRLYVPVVVAIQIVFHEQFAELAKTNSPPGEDTKAKVMPDAPIRPTKPDPPKPDAKSGTGSVAGSGDPVLDAAIAKIDADPLTPGTAGTLAIELQTITGNPVGAGPLLCRLTDTVAEFKVRIHRQYLKETGLPVSVVGYLAFQNGPNPGRALSSEGATGVVADSIVTAMWSFDRSETAPMDVQEQMALLRGAVTGKRLKLVLTR